jgi:ComF family protein
MGVGTLSTTVSICREMSRGLVDLVFPPLCLHCQRPEDFGDQPHLCADCLRAMCDSEFEMCVRCGSRVHSSEYLAGCKMCQGETFRFSRAIAWGNYEGELREAIYRIKRRDHEALAFHVGRCLGRFLLTSGLREFDLVAPVPTHWVRVWNRGMNPAEVIARGVGRELGVRLVPDLLVYVRSTRKQGTLSRNQRFDNVRQAMAVHPRIRFSGFRVLLVDDVMASGATVNEAARALLRSGAVDVTVAVAARGTARG